MTATAPLRVSLFGYAPGDVDVLLSDTRGRLGRLSDRVDRDESALVAVVAELRRWKARARAAEASREDFERALGLARSTAAATMADAEAQADQIVQQARCEAEHLVTCARVEARRAEASERREVRKRLAVVEVAEARLAARERALAGDRARFEAAEARWRRETAWLATQLLSALAPRPAALPAAGDTGPVEDDADTDAELMQDPAVDRMFARFMSQDVDDDPSREWVQPSWPTNP